MLVSFLVFGQISYFLYGRIFSFILHIFGPIYRCVISTFFSFDALIKLRVFISLWFLKELFELIHYFVALNKTYLSDLVKTKLYIQIYDTATKELLPNPRQWQQKLVKTISHVFEKMELFFL